jgi:hypothetical protein
LVVGADVVVAWTVTVAVVLSATALVLWQPCTIVSGRQNFLSGWNAKCSGQVFLTAALPEHSVYERQLSGSWYLSRFPEHVNSHAVALLLNTWWAGHFPTDSW